MSFFFASLSPAYWADEAMLQRRMLEMDLVSFVFWAVAPVSPSQGGSEVVRKLAVLHDWYSQVFAVAPKIDLCRLLC